MKKETIYFGIFLLIMLMLIYYIAAWIKKDSDIIKLTSPSSTK
jgi:hypothetical protein